jgi:hypothetical protein
MLPCCCHCGFSLVSAWLETDPLLLKYKSNDDHPVNSGYGEKTRWRTSFRQSKLTEVSC